MAKNNRAPTASQLESLSRLDGAKINPGVVDDEPLKSSFERIMDAAGQNRFGVFAYGSLMWKPDFKPVFQLPARIHGFCRRPCVNSTVYRGTIKQPGLVFGLDSGGSCTGLALGMPAKNRSRIVRHLFVRECFQGTYWPRMITARPLDGGEEVACLTFVINRRSRSYVPPMPQAKVREIVMQARGMSGSCVDYWRETEQICSELGIRWHLKLHC